MNASMQLEYQMKTCPDRIKYRRARFARRVRRMLGRFGVLAIALVIASVIVFGQRWLLEEGPASLIELGIAARAAEATQTN
jgi:hypothetical protein